MTRFGGGIFSSPIFKWQRRGRNLSKAKDESSHGRRAANADMPIFLTEHMTEHNMTMTEHALDVTFCKKYMEPQDEVVGSPQKDSSTCKEREEPQDEVPMALLHKLANLIKKRDWDQLSTDLSLRGAHEELREYKGLLLHLALRFDAPLSLNSLTTRTLV